MADCPSCNGPLDAALSCAGCGSRFALVPTSPSSAPADPAARLLSALGGAGTAEERERIRADLSRVLAEHGRDDLLLAIWTDIDGPEADLWRGAAAVIGQPGTPVDGVGPLERALHAFLRSGRRDLVAVARAYLIQAYGAARRIADAERVGDAALVAAIEERDAVAVVRAAFSRYVAIAYDVHHAYRFAAAGLAGVVEALRSWAPGHAALVANARARMMLLSDPIEAQRIMAAQPPPDAATAHLRRRQALRAATLRALLDHDRGALDAALADLVRIPPGESASEVGLWISLRRAELALVQGDPGSALAHAAQAMPPPWHHACPLRTEARWVRAEAHARMLPARAIVRRRRAAARAIGRADWFRERDIGWREMRWRLLAGELLRSVRERRGAVRELARARALAEQLGLDRARAEIEAHLRALGQAGRTGQRDHSGAISDASERTSGIGALTPREREIAARIARGATNGDIARALTLAESTVARHVSNILLKLDLPNRRELAARVHASADLHTS